MSSYHNVIELEDEFKIINKDVWIIENNINLNKLKLKLKIKYNDG